MSESEDKIEKVPLSQLESMTEILREKNEAVAVIEMRRALQRQAERDLVIEEMRGVINMLVEGHIVQTSEISSLRRSCEVLERQQREVRERQDIIVAVCDVFAKKLEDQSKTTSALVSHVTDLVEP